MGIGAFHTYSAWIQLQLHRPVARPLVSRKSRHSGSKCQMKTIVIDAAMSLYVMVTILIVLAVLMLLGAIPAWPHSRSWGYGPSGGVGLVLLILVVLVLSGRL
jgi:hypothetical protein